MELTDLIRGTGWKFAEIMPHQLISKTGAGVVLSVTAQSHQKVALLVMVNTGSGNPTTQIKFGSRSVMEGQLGTGFEVGSGAVGTNDYHVVPGIVGAKGENLTITLTDSAVSLNARVRCAILERE